MLRDGAPQKVLDRIEAALEPPLQMRAQILKETWDDDEAFAAFASSGQGFATPDGSLVKAQDDTQ